MAKKIITSAYLEQEVRFELNKLKKGKFIKSISGEINRIVKEHLKIEIKTDKNQKKITEFKNDNGNYF